VGEIPLYGAPMSSELGAHETVKPRFLGLIWDLWETIWDLWDTTWDLWETMWDLWETIWDLWETIWELWDTATAVAFRYSPKNVEWCSLPAQKRSTYMATGVPRQHENSPP